MVVPNHDRENAQVMENVKVDIIKALNATHMHAVIKFTYESIFIYLKSREQLGQIGRHVRSHVAKEKSIEIGSVLVVVVQNTMKMKVEIVINKTA